MEFFGDAAMLHLSVIYENDMNLHIIERDSGTYLDWIGSAGGLNKGLRLMFRLAVGFLNYNVYSVYMVSHLFKLGYQTYDKHSKRRKSTLSGKVDHNMNKETIKLKPNKISSMKMLFFAALPNSWRDKLNENKCKCLRRGENYRMFEKGIKKYEEEIDIVTLIRDLRWLKLAVTELMDEIPAKADRVGRRTEYQKKM